MFKGSTIRGFLLGLLVVAGLAALVSWRVLSHPAPPPPQTASAPSAAAQAPPAPAPPAASATAPTPAASCDAPGWEGAARANQASLYTLRWAPFGPPEIGWATYAPLISREIGARCAADSPGFAESYARWQRGQGLPGDGVVKPAEFDRLRDAWALRRPFVQATAKGACPAPPPASALASARADEGYGGKVIELRPGALAAYRSMVAAARAAGVGARPPLLKLISGYRGPAEEASRCARGGCDKLARATCSAHRTGLALDLYLDPAPGMDPASTADVNRRHMAASVEYRWLLANAARFGFLPYAYEPWHWEWTGEPP